MVKRDSEARNPIFFISVGFLWPQAYHSMEYQSISHLATTTSYLYTHYDPGDFLLIEHKWDLRVIES